MPRIPTAADVSTVGAGASRLATVRAEARDFGSAIGQGLGNLGEGLAGLRPLAEDILRKEEQRQQAEAATDVATHGATLREAAGRSASDWQYDGSAPREAAGKASKELIALSESQLKGLPPPRQAAARQVVAGIAAAYGLHIAQRAQNAAVEALNRKTDSTLQLLQEQAVREPRAAARYADEGSALLHSQREAGALTPEQFVVRNDAFRRGLFAAVIQGQPAADALDDLEAGVYDEALEDAALKDFLLTQARWRLQSEQAQGRAAADALVEGARRGIESPALSARTARLLGAGEMADAELAVERARRAREILEPLRYAPEGLVRQATARPGPASIEADAEERGRLQAELHLQAEAMLRERRHDPAAYVTSQPAVAETFAAAERDPVLLGDAVTARLAAQAAMGLASEEQRALTRPESADILAGLDALPPAERAVALGELGRRYGEASGAVAAALAEAGLSPVEALLLDSAGAPAAWRNLTRLAEQQRQGPQAGGPDAGLIAETAERLLGEGSGNAAGGDYDREGPEDMRLSRESFRPKRNPLREDESLEGRLHIPKLTGSLREQVEVLMKRMGLPGPPPLGAINEPFLDVLKEIAQFRYVIREEGRAGSERVLEMIQNLYPRGERTGLPDHFASQLVRLGKGVLDTPYEHPWSLTDIELTSAIGALAARSKASADRSVGVEVASALASLFIPAGKIGQGIDLALSAIGLADSLSTSDAQKHVSRLVNEAIHRKILIVDPRAVKGAGL